MSADDNKSSGSGGESGGGGGGESGGGGEPRKRPPRRRPRRRRKPGGGGERGSQGDSGGNTPEGGGKTSEGGGQKPDGGGQKPDGGSRSSKRRRRRRSGGGGQAGGQDQKGESGGRPDGKQGQGGDAPKKGRKRKRRPSKSQEGREGDRRGPGPDPKQRGGVRGASDKDKGGGPRVRPREERRDDGPRPAATGLVPRGPEKPGRNAKPLEEQMLWVEVVRDDPDDQETHLDWAPVEDAAERKDTLYNMVQVRFRDRAKGTTFDAGEHMVEPGDELVVETDQGLAVGVAVGRSVRALTTEALPRLIRPLDHGGQRQQRRNRTREEEALEFCRERMEARRLKMKLIRVDYLHGGNKAIFYFTSDSRVDFRELVRDLAQRLHTRIVMRQVGVRDEARMVGGIGSCGCELCCSIWLPRFEPVSIRMAKDQGMVLNPQKVSGQCGRLKCCLGYELTQYLECRKGLPKMGKKVITPQGNGRVVELDILRRLVRVLSSDGTSHTHEAADVKPLFPPQQPRTDQDQDKDK